MSDGDLIGNIEEGSNNIIEGISRLREGLQHYSRSLSIWFEAHPLLKFVIGAPVSAIVGTIGLQILTWGYAYFFGATVPVSRDLKVEVFPAPVGFTLWVLLTCFVLFALLSYFRFVILRQRINQLENQIQG